MKQMQQIEKLLNEAEELIVAVEEKKAASDAAGNYAHQSPVQSRPDRVAVWQNNILSNILNIRWKNVKTWASVILRFPLPETKQ